MLPPSSVHNQSLRKVTRQYLRLVYILLVRNKHCISFCMMEIETITALITRLCKLDTAEECKVTSCHVMTK